MDFTEWTTRRKEKDEQERTKSTLVSSAPKTTGSFDDWSDQRNSTKKTTTPSVKTETPTYSSASDMAADLDRRYKNIVTQENSLRYIEQQMKENPSEALYKSYTERYDLYAKEVENYNALYEQYQFKVNPTTQLTEKQKATTETKKQKSDLQAERDQLNTRVFESNGMDQDALKRLRDVEAELKAADAEESSHTADRSQELIAAWSKQQEALTARDLGTGSAEAYEKATAELNALLRKAQQEDYVTKNHGKTYTDDLTGQFGASYQLGRLSQDSAVAWNEYLKNPSAENRKYAESIDLLIKDFQTNNAEVLKDDASLPWLSQSLAGYLPQFTDQLKSQVVGGASGALAGSLIPGLGTAAGLKAGIVAGSGKYSYDTMRGAAFRELLSMGVDEEKARKAASDEALISSLIEMADTGVDIATLGFGKLINTVAKSGAKAVAGEAAEGAVKKVMKALAGYGLNVAGEMVEEGAQEAVSLANQQRSGTGALNLMGSAIGVGAGALLSGLSGDEQAEDNAKAIKEAAAEGGKIAALMGGATLAGTAVTNAMLNQKPVQQKTAVEKMEAVGTPVQPKTAVDDAEPRSIDKPGATTYNEPVATVSPAADATVQQMAQQAEMVRTANPESDVLDVGTTLYMNIAAQQGKKTLKKSQDKAKVVQKLIVGEEVKPQELNTLNLTDKNYREVFTQLTGVQFPEGTLHTEQMYNLARSAYKVAQDALVTREVTEQQTQVEQQATVLAAKQTKVQEAVKAQEQDAVKPVESAGEDTVQMSRETFAQRYRAEVNAKATDAEIDRQYQTFLRDSETLTLEGLGTITRGEFREQLRQERYPNATDEQLNALFNTIRDKGDLRPAGQAVDNNISEEATHGEETARTQTDGGELRGAAGLRTVGHSAGVEGGAGGTAGQDGTRRDSRPENGSEPGASRAVQRAGLDVSGDEDVKVFSPKPRPNQKAAEALQAKKPKSTPIKVASDFRKVAALSGRNYTKSMREWDKKFRSLDFRAIVTMGPSYHAPSKTVVYGATLAEERIALVQADNFDDSFEQLAGHEYLHAGVMTDRALFDACWSTVLQVSGKPSETLDGVATATYSQSHGRAYAQYEGEELLNHYREEFLADLHGGMNGNLHLPDDVFNRLSSAVREQVAQWETGRMEQQKAEAKAAQQQNRADGKNSDFAGSRVFYASTERSWEDQLATLDEGDDRSALYIAASPSEILQKVGLADLPMCMTRSHARDILHEKSESNHDWHGLSMDTLRRLPELLAEPAMILNSNTRYGDIVVVTTELDADGLPIVVPIHPNGHAWVDGVRGGSNFVLTAYGRNNFAPKSGAESKNNLLYLALAGRDILFWDKKKTETLAQMAGLQLPRILSKVPSDTILKQYRGYVNRKTPERKFSAASVDPMYSQMEKEIEKYKGDKIGASSVVSYLRGKGVKAEEIKWSGIESFLDGKKSVTKAELLEFLRDNRLGIVETTLSEENAEPSYMDEETGELYETFADLEEMAASRAKEQGLDPEDVQYSFGRYGATAYVSKYDDDGFAETTVVLAAERKDNDEYRPRWGEYVAEGGSNYREYLYGFPDSTYSNKAMDVHWGREGVLAHARVQDHQTTDKQPVLFVEEIQSDWHNEGHKKGYASAEQDQLVAEYNDLKDSQKRFGADSIDTDRLAELEKKLHPRNAALQDRLRAIRARLLPGGDLYGIVERVADHFYGGNTKFAMNHILTSRDPHTSYNLMSDELNLNEDEIAQLESFAKERNQWQADNRRYFDQGGLESEISDVPEAPFSKTYHEFVLKNLLRRAVEGGYEYLAWTTAEMQEKRWSSDFAEGYRIEYDQDIPKFLNKYGKQWGAKVGQVQLDQDKRYAYSRETESLRMDLSNWRRELRLASSESEREFIQSQIDHTRNELEALEARIRQSDTVWALPITEPMRQEILNHGQRMFAAAGADEYKPGSLYSKFLSDAARPKVGGAYRISEAKKKGNRYFDPETGEELFLYKGLGMYGNLLYRDEVGEFLEVPEDYDDGVHTPAGLFDLDDTGFDDVTVDEELLGFDEDLSGLEGFDAAEEVPGDFATEVDYLLASARRQYEAERRRKDSPVADLQATPTNTPAFKKWFRDASGELSNEDGSPKLWFHGTPRAGFTRFNMDKMRKSASIYLSSSLGAARNYAYRGMGIAQDANVTPKEFKPVVVDNWQQAVDFTESDLGMTLVLEGDRYALYRNEGDEKPAVTFANTPEGLDKFNKHYGEYAAENSAYYGVYASLSDPLVFDAKGRSWDRLIYSAVQGRFLSTDELANYANEAGYDGAIIKNVRDGDSALAADEFGNAVEVSVPFDEVIVFNPRNVKSAYNTGSWSRRTEDLRFSTTGKGDSSALLSYLTQLEQEYGQGDAQRMLDAFVEMDRSRQAAAQTAESVGAADSGFDPFSHMMNEYGTIEPGETPARVIDVPASTDGKNKVRKTVRTVMEAKATPETRLEPIEKATVDGKFSDLAYANKIAVRRATQKIRKNGWDTELAKWTADARSGKATADIVAMGAVLLDNAGNSKMSDRAYVNLLTDYSEVLHNAGQAVQAARILKTLSPTGQLYAIQGYVDKMNDGRNLRPEDNVPVEEWMTRTGEILADRLVRSAGGNQKKAKTTAQIILEDLNSFARKAFPEKEKGDPRTERDRVRDLFDNYEQYNEAWTAAKGKIMEQYADNPDALTAFENWLATDLANSFVGTYFGVPEIRIPDHLVAAFRDAKTDAERDAAIDNILQSIADQTPASLMEKFTALRYLNMLGNFKTQIRNVVGNAAAIPVRATKDFIGAAIESALAASGKNIERTKSFTKDKETYRAAIGDFEVVRDIILNGGKYDDSRKYTQAIEEKRRIFKSKFLESYRKATDWAMNNERFGDAGFAKFAYADALAGYLSANGATFESASPELLDKAREYAVRQAAEATYRDNNALSSAISAMRFRNPDTWAKKGINTIGEGLLPFRRTPANILVRAVEYSPVGFITTAAEAIYGKTIKKEALSATRLVEQLSKNLTGTALAALGFGLFSQGLLRGKDPDKEKEADYEELLGHQAYSIELPNGMSLTLDWLSPASIPIFLGAQVADAALENGLTLREGLQALASITDPMLQMSMLQGVNDALENAATYGDDSALVRLTGNALWGFFTQGLTNTLLGQLERSMSNDRMSTYVDKNGLLPDALQRLLGQFSAKTPFWDYSQIPYIDAWGRTEQNATSDTWNVVNQLFNPAYTSQVNESEMETELRRLYESTGNTEVLPSRARSYFNVDEQRVDLTAEQYVEYSTVRGQTSYAVLSDLTTESDYLRMDDDLKEKAVVKVFSFANALAKAQATGYGPEQWDTEASVPEGAAVPDAWVMEAAVDADKYGIPVSTYVLASVRISDVKGIPDPATGKTRTGSVALQKAQIIRSLGLSERQTKKLLNDFDVGQTYQDYSLAMINSKLAAMRK